MLAIIRVIIVLVFSISICTGGILYCLIQPFRPYCVSVFAHMFGYMACFFGLKIEVRNSLKCKLPKNCIYVSNHQNNYDMIAVSYVVPPRTITVGKKSLLWIPFFGQLFWLSGNILIDRSRKMYLRSFIKQVIKKIRLYNCSIWIFPEGTRNYGRGLLPFKPGAFYAAIFAKIPIVPICVSNISNNKIKLNRKSNGLVIIEFMEPIYITTKCDRSQVRFITKSCYDMIMKKCDELNKEIKLRECI